MLFAIDSRELFLLGVALSAYVILKTYNTPPLHQWFCAEYEGQSVGLLAVDARVPTISQQCVN